MHMLPICKTFHWDCCSCFLGKIAKFIMNGFDKKILVDHHVHNQNKTKLAPSTGKKIIPKINRTGKRPTLQFFFLFLYSILFMVYFPISFSVLEPVDFLPLF